MTDPVFIHVTETPNLFWSDVELIQVAAIGAVRKTNYLWHDGAYKPSVIINAPRDLEGTHLLVFEKEEHRDEFFKRFLGVLRRKASVVVI